MSNLQTAYGGYDVISGRGIFLRDPNRNPPKVRKLLEKIGNQPVTSLMLVRTPLEKGTKSLLNIASFGKLNDSLRESQIDKLFHLSLFINNKYILEKNDVINMAERNPVTDKSETLVIPVDKPLTINELIENTRVKMGNNYAPYNALDNNCSVFVDNVLKANGLQTDNGHIFVHQRVRELFDKFPSLTKILTNFATTAGAFVDRQIQGEGERRKIHNFGLREF